MNPIRIALTLLITATLAPPTLAADSPRTWVDAQALNSYLADAAAKGFEGLVGISDANGTLYLRAYGDAVKNTTPYDDTTLVDIASITKQFTGAAVLKLREQGKLKLTDRLDRFFPTVPADKAAITLHQLLTHTAGFPDLLGRDEEIIGRSAFLKRAFGHPLDKAPGDAEAYSNVGYSILAAVIEKASGQDYETYLYENLWKPVGMFTTGYYRPDWRGHTVPRIEKPYKGMASQKALLERGRGDIWNLNGNGGLLSTVSDMLRWHRALLGTKVLTAASKKLLFTPHVPEEDEGYFYGYGWSIVPDFHGQKLVWHNGGSYFSRADFWRFPQTGMAIFVATHKRSIEPYYIAGGVAAILRGEKPTLIKP